MAQSVLVIGSTGNVGRQLVRELVAAGESVRAASRKPAKLSLPSGAEAVEFDYADADSFGPALEGVDRVFVMAPPDYAQPRKLMLPFLEIAARNDRRFVLMSASGVEFDDKIPLRQVELYLQRCAKRTVILRPNSFMDNFHTFWLPSVRGAGAIQVPAGDSRSASIHCADIAACAAAALRTGDYEGHAWYLTGPESLTYAEAAQTLSAAAGRQIRYEPKADTSFTQSLVAAGVPEDYAEYVTRLFVFIRQGAAANVSDCVERMTGRTPRTLREYAAEHADAWK